MPQGKSKEEPVHRVLQRYVDIYTPATFVISMDLLRFIISSEAYKTQVVSRYCYLLPTNPSLFFSHLYYELRDSQLCSEEIRAIMNLFNCVKNWLPDETFERYSTLIEKLSS